MTSVTARPLPAAFLPMGRPCVVGHRGASAAAPENTLASFDAAWRAGADAIELDLRLTADGVVVVIHDDTVDATTDGSGAVGLLTFAALRTLDAGSWFAPAFAGQPIPRLEEVLRYAASRPALGVLLEYKGSWTAEKVAPTVASIDAAGVGDRTVVQSFTPRTLAALRDAAPDLPRGLLVNPSTEAVRAEPALVRRLHESGRRVMVWTENDPAGWADLVAAGVDAIITDRPEHLRGWLADSGRRVSFGAS
jgi:glycerophosphoryl diester phosphodiesterase